MESPAAAAAKSISTGSSRLISLAQQLRLYKPPEESTGKLISPVGFQESMPPAKKASVLICLFEGDGGDLRVILTKRSSGLSSHSGEVSLPGGKAEEDDEDDGVTATREAEEEIGLHPSLVDVVAFLEPFLSQHLLRVTPVVGILWDRKAFNPTPNPAEVEAVFDAPLEMFLKDENRRSEEIDWMGKRHLLHFFDYNTGDNDYVIWGLTAIILIRVASVVYQRPPAFGERIPNFKYPRMNKATSLYGLLKVLSSWLGHLVANFHEDRWRHLCLVLSQYNACVIKLENYQDWKFCANLNPLT